MYHNCASLCLLCGGKEGEKTIYISLVLMNYRNLHQRVAVISLGLIATLASGYGECDVGTQDVKNFNCTRLGISLLTIFLQVAVKTALCFYISLEVPLRNSQWNISE